MAIGVRPTERAADRIMPRTEERPAEHGLLGPPPALLEAVDETCRALTAAASGRVFAVPEHGIESALQSEQAGGARYDTILSFMRTPRLADVEGFVAALERILAEGGWIFMVEPSATGAGAARARLRGSLGAVGRVLWPGFGRLGGSLAARPGRGSPRRRAGTDVVAALRSGGLVVTDLCRLRAPSAPGAWRRYVVLKARRESPRAADP